MTIIAISSAIFTGAATLLGVFVGAILTMAREFILARRRERADARAGARLVQLDLKRAASTTRVAREFGYWTPGTSLAVKAWDAHSAALARQLTSHQWDAVAMSISFLEQAEDIDRKRGLPQTEAQPLDPILNKVLGAVQYRTIAAHDALCEIAQTAEFEQAAIGEGQNA